MTNRAIMLFALLSLATVAYAAPEPSIALPADLARVLRDYEAAWSTMDTTSLARLFAEDGFVLSHGHEPVRGRAAIEAFYRGQGGPQSLRPLAFGAEGQVGYIIGGFSAILGQPRHRQVHADPAQGSRRPMADRVRYGQLEPASGTDETVPW